MSGADVFAPHSGESRNDGGGVNRRTVLAASAALLVAAAPAVEAKAGRFTGTREGGIYAFRGIRYGRAARFMPPVAEPPADVPATAYGPSAPQGSTRYQPQSEDCLFLNVWTPGPDARARRPVMVYIHGGAYSNGSVADAMNDGARLAAAGDCVVVTVNHRLNALGYLYLARLDQRFPDSGNCGQLDLILALKWVQANIAGFGGDAANVTVFGQSGGGAKIATLMGTPAARGLFHRAATMSGQQVTASGPLNATKRARAYLAKLGRDPATAPLETLIEALDATDPVLGGGVYFGPVLDMRTLTRHPFWPDANPQSNAVPMLLGNTRDEARAFLPAERLTDLTWETLPARITPELRVDIHPEWVTAQFRARYPALSPREILWAAVTAGRSWRGQIEEADARARADAPTWVYRCDFADPARPERGSPHTMDIPLVFGTIDAPDAPSGSSASARAASDAMMTAFVRFARTGTCAWPQYRTDKRTTMIFDAAPHVEDDPRGWERQLFARVPYIQPGT